MPWGKPAPERERVEVVQSTHGHTFVTWPTDMALQGSDLPALPLAHSHPRSRQWLLADKTGVVILPGDPQHHEGGVIRHTYDVVSATWNARTKTLTTTYVHPSNSEVTFNVTTSGMGCACTQGPAGNAGPINGPYEIAMVKAAGNPDLDWFAQVAG